MLENIMAALGGAAGKKSNTQNVPAVRGYGSKLTLVSGDAAFDTAAEVVALLGAAGTIRRIWEYTVPAQRVMRWGFGSAQFPQNQGYIFFAIADAGTDISHGIVTLGYENYGRRKFVAVEDFDDTDTHTTTATSIATLREQDKNKRIALPEGGSAGVAMMVGQDSRLCIDYRMITAATGADIADFSIPVTIYE